MKLKKGLSLLLSLSFLASCTPNNTQVTQNRDTTPLKYNVRFLANIPGVECKLSSGKVGTADNLLYESIEVLSGEKVDSPVDNPARVGYNFTGWFLEKECINEYDFSLEVTSNLNLYAGWARKNSDDNDDFKEVDLGFVEEIDSNVEEIKINGVLNFPVENSRVMLTKVGLKKLINSSNDVKELLNYKINPNCTILSATYSNNLINVNYTKNKESKNIQINVIDVTNQYVIDNSTYENKAKKFEETKDLDPYKIVLCGSSSIENWSTSTKDMEPLTTINVGIGGTTIDQWINSLAKRLVYSYNPRAVVMYVGINNVINSHDSGEEIGNKLSTLFDQIHTYLPNTQIYYILMNLIPNFMSYKSVIEKGNELALKYGENKDYMNFINPGTLLLKKNGDPNHAYFLSDGLHMSIYGYVIWGAEVKRVVIEKEKELYK